MNSKDFFNLTLPEQLILLSIDESGRPSWNKPHGWLLGYGVNGAVLQELFDRKKIKFVVEEYKQNNELLGKDNIITIADSGRINDPLLDQAFAALESWLKQYPAVSGLSRSAAQCIWDNPFRDAGAVFHRRLVDKRILRPVRKRLFGIIPWAKDFVAEKTLYQEIKQTIKDNLQLPLSVEQPMTKVLLLAAACRLELQSLLPAERQGQHMKDIDTLVNSNPASEGVARAIEWAEHIPSL